MTCLAFKSETTRRLQTNPIVAGKFTLPKSNKEYKCDISAYEMSLSHPVEGTRVSGLQMCCPYIPDKKDFSDMTRRHKEALACIFRCGIWKNLSTDSTLSRFAVKTVPRSLQSFDGKQDKNVYILDVLTYTDGDLNHIYECLKRQGSITVPCSDREADEDPTGDTKYPSATLVFHQSYQNAIKATLEKNLFVDSDALRSAVVRVEQLKTLQPLVIEICSVLTPIGTTPNQRCEVMRLGLVEALIARAGSILELDECTNTYSGTVDIC
jgi:hypothetical protein